MEEDEPSFFPRGLPQRHFFRYTVGENGKEASLWRREGSAWRSMAR